MRYNLTYKNNQNIPDWYWDYFKTFPWSFTKEEIVSHYSISEKQWNYLRKYYLEKCYDPKEEDPFKKYRGELYNPDHKLNLVTGWPEQQLKASPIKRYV